MRLTYCVFAKRGWPTSRTEPARSQRFVKYGPVKWRDYQAKEFDPPYWYKWSTQSPYSPNEQMKIAGGHHISWYQHNFHKLKLVPPDKWLYNVGDVVEILVGKDKGKQGEVIQVIPQGNLIVIGGLNCKWSEGDGERSQRNEEPLMHHEVSLLDPIDSKPVAVEFRADSDGKRVRVSLRSEHIIPWPIEKLHDGTFKNEYKCTDKDTFYDDACEKTFSPSLESWEEQLKNAFNLTDPPTRNTFWY